MLSEKGTREKLTATNNNTSKNVERTNVEPRRMRRGAERAWSVL